MPQPRRPRAVPPPAEAPDMTVPSLGGEADPIGSRVVTETQLDRDARNRPVGAEPDVEERLAALHQTDLRQQVEIGDHKRRVTVLEEQHNHLVLRVQILETTASGIDDHEKRIEALETADSGSPGYNWKAVPEIAWAIGTTLAAVLLQALTDVDRIEDWRAWAIGVGAACVRAVLGLILAQGKVSSGVTPTPPNHHPTT